MQRALLQSKTASAVIVENAGTNQFQILHMENIKISLEKLEGGQKPSSDVVKPEDLHAANSCHFVNYKKKIKGSGSRPQAPL